MLFEIPDNWADCKEDPLFRSAQEAVFSNYCRIAQEQHFDNTTGDPRLDAFLKMAQPVHIDFLLNDSEASEVRGNIRILLEGFFHTYNSNLTETRASTERLDISCFKNKLFATLSQKQYRIILDYVYAARLEMLARFGRNQKNIAKTGNLYYYADRTIHLREAYERQISALLK